MPRKVRINATYVPADWAWFSPPQIERFWSRVVIGDSCWLYDHPSCTLPNGYVFFSGKFPGDLAMRIYAHRLSWSIANGRNPGPGLHIDHTCNVRNCVKPSHLEEVTPLENTRRKHARNPELEPPGASLWRGRSHCTHGHEWTEENTARVPYTKKTTGETLTYRKCRTCARISVAASKKRRADNV